jgi:hypothetical protein
VAQRKQIAVIVLVGACAILIGFVLGDLTGFKYGKNQNKAYVPEVSSPPSLPANSISPVFDLSSIEIMKELNCVCGCNMELQPCTCDKPRGSQEIRAFVQTLVQQGLSRPEITTRLTEKYGEAILIKQT